ncbi:NADH:ubiquinone reductase (Na(+)-transporting) subunit C [Bacteroides caecigallinarum]|uniref:NADH:ubiquinone reductase (Na(+)-transporting) subunit C n=1 Tax=Bacteroides TaxID=816 RepID=UPI0008224039|nr:MULTISPECIES: NADH:ubiquinone reductase (Na(+)-transporting) subunit C [Bacteroides]MBU3809860.1 NADH:ubiquinone reductase (Na(+)-transporting) subunit C [Candidatus Phocaeicola faecipullorum]MBM6864372.1 NADH:ubiquinone reductase (Na(+)-transporting) subunit C [Bacteroides caecigallinarum]MBM6960882.1 NADH:ubiquinone reductase (Na(+)-transporting) subunit C [Bacteroides caecigallinarum]MCF2738499.1 NADH:ubiquinone reductase (Na(+)-transporting) subunit C [Bacteroides caecigallinarum]MCR889
MNTNSNSYTIIYASVMVVIVAFLLAFVNSSLRDLQGKNVELDTKKQILSALGIREVENAEAKFAEVVKEDMLVAEDGSLKPYEGSFVTGYEKAYKEKGEAHIFVCEIDGQKKYVIPVYGTGLWGAIWGYVALNDDKDTVYGTYFSHASETPGLGAEIATEHFQNEFKDKNVLDGDAIGLDVVKNGKVDKPEFQVDGISGGTITSVAVGQMLKNCMGNYTKFLTAKE